jgi:outer membrane biosynthesis protein TonB
MKESYRPYLLISLGIHLCLFALLFLVKGPQAPEVPSRRVVVRFSAQERKPVPSRAAGSAARAALPVMEPRELVGSLQLKGPAALKLPTVRAAAGPAVIRGSEEAVVERAAVRGRDEPLLPGKALAAAAPAPEQLFVREAENEVADAAESRERDSGFTPAAALEWKGKERSLLKQATIDFPTILLEEGLEVDVEAAFTVAPSGQVVEVEIIRSSGLASVDRAVERALLGYLFNRSGDSGTDKGRIKFRFRLERSD